MKQLIQLFTLGVALLAVSCSQESGSGEAPAQEQTTITKLDLSMEVDINDDELRNAMQVEFGAANAFKLVLPTLKNGDVVPLKLAFSNGASLDHHEVNFTYRDGKLRYSGEIAVTDYIASPNVTSPQWYVMAFFGGARIANQYHYAPQLLSLTRLASGKVQLGNPGRINVPFVSRWTPVTRTGANRGEFSVTLNPLGHFLRLQVENERDHSLRIQGFELVSNDYLSSIHFRPDHTAAALQRGDFPVVGERAANGINYTGGHTVAKGTATNPTKSEVYFLWVMPKTPKTAEGEIGINVIHYNNGGAWKFPFKVKVPASGHGFGGKQTLRTLKVKNDHKIYRPLYAIDYIALGNINAQGVEVPEGTKGADITYTNYIKPPTIVGAGMRNMTESDWMEIIPRSNSTSYVPHTYNGASNADGRVLFLNSTVNTSNNYTFPAGTTADSTKLVASTGKSVLYAKRRIATDKQAAYRYTLTVNGDLTVEMVHLGKEIFDSFNGRNYVPTIEQISSDANFWNAAQNHGEVVKRVFPGQGNRTYYMGMTDTGNTLRGVMWNFTTGRIGQGIVGGATSNASPRQVRLVHATPRDLPANN